MGFQIGHLTDRGRVRELNEDSYLILTQPNLPPNVTLLLAVADGMGGHQAGDMASGYTIASLDQFFSTGQFQQLVDYSPGRADYYAAVLKDVIEAVNDRLLDLSTQLGVTQMGTTATVALLSGQQLFIGHVGDSRAYLLRNGLLQQITQDHSWVADQVASGAMTASEAYYHPKKNLLLRALGNNVVVRVDRMIQDVYPGDTLILCSDGLTNKVNPLEMTQIVTGQPDPKTACRQLVQLANSRGGEDNITVLIARLDSRNAPSLPGGRVFGPHRQASEAEKNLANTDRLIRPATTAAPAKTIQLSAQKSPKFSRISTAILALVILIFLQLSITAVVFVISSKLTWSTFVGGSAGLGFIIGLLFSYWLFATHQS
ncbi:MAG: Stp1/IreP family PP2C-type Ser/Thr phosphatase [Anaerolineae bacterium]|nr:Stp1/IreP family PP2C-type Ser/Thr phosphatase [Anaerolineae bacterium]